MGVVASLISAPVTIEIFKDELIREQERRDDLRYGKRHVGNTDLATIKRLATSDGRNNYHNSNSHGAVGVYNTPLHHHLAMHNKDVEKIYLTGQSKEKYKYISNKIDKNEVIYNPPGSNRKIRSAYPNVRLS